MAKRMSPEVYHAIGAALWSFLLYGILYGLIRFSFTWYNLAGVWLVAISLVTFCYYGFDKYRARSNGDRIPEVVLHGLAILGGTLGAYLGMWFFRHKTIKSSFRFVFWFIAVFQGLLLMAIVYRIWVTSQS